MYIDDSATPDEVAEMAAEQRELRRLWMSDPRIVMAQVIQPDGRQGQVPVAVQVTGERAARLKAPAALRPYLITGIALVYLTAGMAIAGVLPAWLPIAAWCGWMAVMIALAWRRRAG